MAKKLKRSDLIYPELSYTIVGILFEVYNNLGPGHKERYYQKAVVVALRIAKISFKEQVYPVRKPRPLGRLGCNTIPFFRERAVGSKAPPFLTGFTLQLFLKIKMSGATF